MDEKPPDMIEKEQYLRLAADFDNYRKRMEQELATTIAFGNQKILLEIADVLDVIDRAKMREYDVAGLLEQIIKKQGMIRIETIGKAFEPLTMEAVSMTEGGESQTVQSEVRAGYQIHDRVIRPARVIIYQ